MSKLIALLLILLLPARLSAQTTAISPARPIVLTHVTAVDVTGGESGTGMTVAVAGKRMTAFGKTGI